jgi:hypothetical protein
MVTGLSGIAASQAIVGFKFDKDKVGPVPSVEAYYDMGMSLSKGAMNKFKRLVAT